MVVPTVEKLASGARLNTCSRIFPIFFLREPSVMRER